jgi:two-component system response regulator LytT
MSARFLGIRRYGRIEILPLDNLTYAKAMDKYCELAAADGSRRFYDRPIAHLEQALPESFVRIHKSYLVRFACVARVLVLRGSRYYVELQSGQRLPVGRTRYRRIKALFV